MNNLIKLNNSLSRKFIISIFTYFSILFSTCLSYNNDDRNLQKSNIFNKREPLKNDTASDTTNNTLKEILTLLSENKIILIVAGTVFFILVIFYFYARRKHKEGRNAIIFTVTLIIVDLILDLAFLTNNILRPDGRYLLIPSLVVLVLPAGVNLLLASTIIINQSRKNNNNLKFRNWLHEHAGFASAMTILSMLNIEALRILNSNFLNKKIFTANFNQKALKLIIIGGLINIFIVDIPQFVILIIYKRGRIELEFIPLLTLVSNFILLLSDFISRIYELVSLD